MPHTQPPVSATNSHGQLGAEAAYLDARFRAMQPEYEAMLRGVGFQPGSVVLDAGCGGGSSLPLLSTLIGSDGYLHALDLAPENITAVQRLAHTGAVQCPVTTHVGSVLALPLADRSVDGVWNANVSQYLRDAELRIMLDEFRRVTCPGGTVAVKEVDARLVQVHPIPPMLMWHMFEAAQRHGVIQPSGCLRTAELPRWLRDVGLINIAVRSTLIIRRAPLRPVERRSLHEIIQMLVQFAVDAQVSDDELDQWRAYADPDRSQYVLDYPDLCWIETQTVITGQVPDATFRSLAI